MAVEAGGEEELGQLFVPVDIFCFQWLLKTKDNYSLSSLRGVLEFHESTPVRELGPFDEALDFVRLK